MSDEPVSQSAAIDAPVVPSTPDPTITAMVAMLLRYAAAGLGAAGLVHGSVASVPWEAVAGPLVMVGTLVWAIIDRIRMARQTHAAAVASASKRVPVQPA
jgi:hypothetical protein